MRTIKISDKVWEKIADNGKFGETEDDVLKRLLGLKPTTDDDQHQAGPRVWKQRRTTERMTQNNCRNGELVLEFDSGALFKQKLPDKNDIPAIRKLRNAAVTFVKKNGGTIGQEHAAIRALTSNGYHVTRQTDYI